MKSLLAVLFSFVLAPVALAQPGGLPSDSHVDCLPAEPKDATIVFIGRPTEIIRTSDDGAYRHILYAIEADERLKGPVPKSIRFERTAAKPGQPIYGWGQEELRVGTAYGFALWFNGEDGAYHDDEYRECVPSALVIASELLDRLRTDFPAASWRERVMSWPGIGAVAALSLAAFLVLLRRYRRARSGPGFPPSRE